MHKASFFFIDIHNLFARVHFHTASRMVLALLAATLYVCPETNIFVSSAKRTKQEIFEH